MISVILYGRNDAHGYNLHRRAALSLNCIAEVLTDPDDELIFVDYNTPDELPTFIEAISDTLTGAVPRPPASPPGSGGHLTSSGSPLVRICLRLNPSPETSPRDEPTPRIAGSSQPTPT